MIAILLKASTGFARNGPSRRATPGSMAGGCTMSMRAPAIPILLLHGNPTWGFLYRHVIPPLVKRDTASSSPT